MIILVHLISAKGWTGLPNLGRPISLQNLITGQRNRLAARNGVSLFSGFPCGFIPLLVPLLRGLLPGKPPRLGAVVYALLPRVPLDRALRGRGNPEPREILLLRHQGGGLGQHGVHDNPSPPKTGEGAYPNLHDGHLGAGELLLVRADGAGLQRDPDRRDAAHLAEADIPLEVLAERGACSGQEAGLDEGAGPELREPGERAGDGDHGGEDGAAHEEEPLPPYRRERADQGPRPREQRRRGAVVGVGAVVAVVGVGVGVSGLAGGGAGVGDLEAEQPRRVEASEGEEGARGQVEAATARAPPPARRRAVGEEEGRRRREGE